MPYRATDNQDEGDVYTGTRVCRKCGQRFPMTEFFWTGTRKHRRRTCRACVMQRQNEIKEVKQQEDPQAFRDRAFRYAIRRNWGLTFVEYQRLLESQHGACAICAREIIRGKAHIDHDHATGEIRGILCQECNLGLGKFSDDIELLRSAISYLEAPKPDLTLRSRGLTPTEQRETRSGAAAAWHASAEGRAKIRARSLDQSGERNPLSKLSDTQRRDIIRRYRAGGISQYDLAIEYGVSQVLVSRLVLGKTILAKQAMAMMEENGG